MPSPERPAVPISLFYSYSHKDEALRDELETHLTLLRRQGVVRGWHDRCIPAGTEWAGQIDQHLEAADVILLLVSADFLASDYCYDKEMERALERHGAGAARVIPVILRPVDWHAALFWKLQALPRDGKPVTMWGNRDEAFADIARGIREVAESLKVAPHPRSAPEETIQLSQPWRFDLSPLVDACLKRLQLDDRGLIGLGIPCAEAELLKNFSEKLQDVIGRTKMKVR